jgi:outer membrane protein TolC
MKPWLIGLVLLCPLAAWSDDGQPLTLQQALAAADAPYPQLDIAKADLAIAQADQQLAASSTDVYVDLEGELRSGIPDTGPNEGSLTPDNMLRLVANKPLFDFGYSRRTLEAAKRDTRSRELNLLQTRDARRIAIMARFFEVLMADMEYSTASEYLAVAYTHWDDSKSRLELGQISQSAFDKLESTYMDFRERRSRAAKQLVFTRQKLADAMNRPGQLPRDLATPDLSGNNVPLPDYQSLLPLAEKGNPEMRALQARIEGTMLRAQAVRDERKPTVDVQLIGASYSRKATTRDRVSAGLVLNWPLYEGGRNDALVARELAQRDRLVSQLAQTKLDLSEQLMDLLDEIDSLRTSSRQAAKAESRYRDAALDRARGEYEMEYRTNLGFAMADEQAAEMRKTRVEFRIALALEKLKALVGEPMEDISALAGTKP